MNQVDIDLASLRQQINERSKAIHESVQGRTPPPPPTLYHYTTAAGLLGILRSKTIWATDYRFLNDASEVEYGIALLKKVASLIMTRYQQPAVKEMIARAASMPAGFERSFDCYVACFCAQEELLHQWRFYAESGGGVAIGFDAAELAMRARVKSTRERAMLVPVEYDPGHQELSLVQLFSAAIELMGPYAELEVHEAIDCINLCSGFIRGNAMRYFLTFKHPAFEVEKEWRLVLVPFDTAGTELEFRDGPFGLTPYVEIHPFWDTEPSAGRPMPLTSVTHGPVGDPSTAKLALQKLLRSSGYRQTTVKGSQLPFRIPMR